MKAGGGKERLKLCTGQAAKNGSSAGWTEPVNCFHHFVIELVICCSFGFENLWDGYGAVHGRTAFHANR